MKKQAYIQPVTECVVAYADELLETLTASVNNGNPSNMEREETIGFGGSTPDGDFAKYDTGWGNLWED